MLIIIMISIFNSLIIIKKWPRTPHTAKTISYCQCNQHASCNTVILGQLLEKTIKQWSIEEPFKVEEPLCSKYDKPEKAIVIK